MTPRTPTAPTKPSFIHHDKITKGLGLIFGSTRESVKISDINVLEMLKLIPITPNSISLLSGIMGTGKTSYARAFTKSIPIRLRVNYPHLIGGARPVRDMGNKLTRRHKKCRS